MAESSDGASDTTRVDLVKIQHLVGEKLLGTQRERPRPAEMKSSADIVEKRFQQQALDFMVTRELDGLQSFLPALHKDVRGGALCSPTGTGKTFMITQVGAHNLLDSPQIKKLIPPYKIYIPVNLVVCPIAISRHWGREISKGWPSAQVFDFVPHGTGTAKTHAKRGLLENSKHHGKLFVPSLGKQKTPVALEEIPANSFVIVSWECLPKELDYDEAGFAKSTRKAGAVMWSLSAYYFGRIVFDEGQFVGKKSSKRGQMADRLESLFRWYQSATPVQQVNENVLQDFKRVVEFLDMHPYSSPHWWKEHVEQPIQYGNYDDFVTFLSSFMWCHTRRQVKDQMNIPPLISVPRPIQFSLLEREYCRIAKLSPTDARAFCKMYPSSTLALTLAVADNMIEEIGALEIKKAHIMYYHAMSLFKQRESPAIVIKILEETLELCERQNPNPDIASMMKHDSLEWRKLTARVCAMLLFLHDSMAIATMSPWTVEKIKQVLETNKARFLSSCPKCLCVQRAQSMMGKLKENFRELLMGQSCETVRTCQKLKEVWDEYKQFDSQTLQVLESQRTSGIRQSILPALKQYESLHLTLDIIFDPSQHLRLPKSMTLNQKIVRVVDALAKKFRQMRWKENEICNLREYCLFIDCTNNKNLNAVKICAANRKKNIAAQQKDWARSFKSRSMRDFLARRDITPQNCHKQEEFARKEWDRLTNAANSVECIKYLLENDLALDPKPLKKLDRIVSKTQDKLKRPDEIDVKEEKFEETELNLRYRDFKTFQTLFTKTDFSCALCSRYFSRSRIPIKSECCQLALCHKCTLVKLRECPGCRNKKCLPSTRRDENINMCHECKNSTVAATTWECKVGLCGKCDLARRSWCPLCLTTTKRSLPDIPSGLQMSQKYRDNINMLGQWSAPNSTQCFGSKLDHIQDLLNFLFANPSARADDTRGPRTNYRKVIVFDADVKFLIQLQWRLQNLSSFKTFLLDKRVLDFQDNLNSFIDLKESAVLLLDPVDTAGLHLVVSDCVIICSPLESAVNQIQAQSRSHRFGQNQSVSVYHCYLENSIEETVFHRTQRDMRKLEAENQYDKWAEKVDYYSDDENKDIGVRPSALDDLADVCQSQDSIGNEFAQNAGNDVAQNAGSDFAQNAGSDFAQNAGSDFAQNAGSDFAQNAGSDFAQNAGDELNAGNDVAQNASVKVQPMTADVPNSDDRALEVPNMLITLGLGAYQAAFTEHGYERLEDLCTIKEQYFAEMGVKRGARGRIVNYLSQKKIKIHHLAW